MNCPKMLQRSSASASASCFSTKILELGVATNFSAISKCKLLLDNITNLLLDAEAEARRAAGRPPEGRRRRHRRVAVREQREGEEDVGVVVEPARPPRPRPRSWSWIPADEDGLGGGEADREGKRASESDGKAGSS